MEFYELELAAGSEECANPHPPAPPNLVVAAGTVKVRVDGEDHRLKTGDALLFVADGPAHYPGQAAAMVAPRHDVQRNRRWAARVARVAAVGIVVVIVMVAWRLHHLGRRRSA